jgi:hypothetical protein
MRQMVGNREYLCTKCGQTRRAPNPHVIDVESSRWPNCCGRAMTLMGHRQAQAAALLDPDDRLKWMKAGAMVMKGSGRRKWRPILSANQMEFAYPLP